MTGASITGRQAFDITPDDNANISLCMVRVGTTAGDIKVTPAEGADMTFKNVAVGEIIPCWVSKVYSTGTTAVGLEGIK